MRGTEVGGILGVILFFSSFLLRFEFGSAGRARHVPFAEWFESFPTSSPSNSESSQSQSAKPSLRYGSRRSPIVGESQSIGLPIKRFEIGGGRRVGCVIDPISNYLGLWSTEIGRTLFGYMQCNPLPLPPILRWMWWQTTQRYRDGFVSAKYDIC